MKKLTKSQIEERKKKKECLRMLKESKEFYGDAIDKIFQPDPLLEFLRNYKK